MAFEVIQNRNADKYVGGDQPSYSLNIANSFKVFLRFNARYYGSEATILGCRMTVGVLWFACNSELCSDLLSGSELPRGMIGGAPKGCRKGASLLDFQSAARF